MVSIVVRLAERLVNNSSRPILFPARASREILDGVAPVYVIG